MDDSQPDGDRQIYFENMSRAFAQLCSGSSLVMTNDPQNVPMTGIFGRIELPTAQQDTNIGGQVNLVSSHPLSTFCSFCALAADSSFLLGTG